MRLDHWLAEKEERERIASTKFAERARLAAIQGDGGRDGRLTVIGYWWLKGKPIDQTSHDMMMLHGVPSPRQVEPYSRGGQGGPGFVRPYHDDGVHPGPGELEQERHHDHLI